VSFVFEELSLLQSCPPEWRGRRIDFHIHSKEIGVVKYTIGVEGPITPDESLPSLPDIPRGALVVIEGRAPIWRYGMAFHRLHGSPAGAIAVFDPRLGAVVVASHREEWREGQVIDLPSA
jgi:CRISPR-associated protein Csx3